MRNVENYAKEKTKQYVKLNNNNAIMYSTEIFSSTPPQYFLYNTYIQFANMYQLLYFKHTTFENARIKQQSTLSLSVHITLIHTW